MDLNTIRRMAGVSEVFAGDKAEYTVKPQLNEAKDMYGEELDKLSKVIQSVKTPEQLASAEKYADLMFKKIKKGVRATDTFGSGFERLLGIVKALEKDLAAKKKSLSAVNEDYENEETSNITQSDRRRLNAYLHTVRDPSASNHQKDVAKKRIEELQKSLSTKKVNEDCGMSHGENEEAEVGYVECPLCGDTLEAPEFYDHMMDKHKAVMRGPYDDAAEDEEISYEDEEAMNYKSSLNKGQHVEYNGQPHIVVVPDAQGDFVGIAPVGQEDDPDAVNLVHAREIMNGEEEEVVMDVRLEGVVSLVKDAAKAAGRKLKVSVTKGTPSLKNAPSWAKFIGKTPEGAFHWLSNETPLETNDSDKYFPKADKTEFTGFVDSKGKGSVKPISQVTEAEDATVWDKAMTDKDESPENPKADDGKVTVPSKVKSALKKESKELRTAAEKVKVSDADRAEFYNNCAAAMEKLLTCLDYGTVEGVKKAQIHMTSLMSPILQRIPDVAHDFITGGGAPTTLKNLFKKVKEKK